MAVPSDEAAMFTLNDSMKKLGFFVEQAREFAVQEKREKVSEVLEEGKEVQEGTEGKEVQELRDEVQELQVRSKVSYSGTQRLP